MVYYVQFFVFFDLRHWWVSQVLTARMSPRYTMNDQLIGSKWKQKRQLENDLGLVLLAQFSCSQKCANAVEPIVSRERQYVYFLFFLNNAFESTSLFTGFYYCGVIEGSFKETETSWVIFFYGIVRYNWWLVKDMCKFRLLLNVMLVFNENIVRCSVWPGYKCWR